VSNAEQKARDSDRRRILEDELRAAETKLAELKKEYNNGEPERRGDERNAVKYQERIAQLKADVTRAEADVNAIKREIGNLKD
jgi:chromosome segregation ATPase